ncbi:MAG: hypothetical protein AAGH57_05645 [Pseudomonadota bacterium]
MTRYANVFAPSAALALMAGLSLAITASAAAQDSEGSDPPAEPAAEEPREMTKGEKRLAKMLEGRVAGEPENCIRLRPNESSRTIDKTAYVFGRGGTIWVQRTTRPDRIDDRNTLVIARAGAASRLCRQQTIQTVDQTSGAFSGTVILVEFIPFKRISEGDKSES